MAIGIRHLVTGEPCGDVSAVFRRPSLVQVCLNVVITPGSGASFRPDWALGYRSLFYRRIAALP